jgi:long-chain acyl-CoA synthetase
MESRIWHHAYDAGVPAEIGFAETALPEHLNESAARFGDRPALRFLNRRMSYRELDAQVDRFAAALAGLGVAKGDRVAIQLPNLPQTIISFYGTLRLGAVAVMTNPLYVARELEHQWNDAGCKIAITTDFLYAGRIEPIRDKLPVEHFVIAEIAEYLRFPLKQLAPIKLKRTTPPLCADVKPGPGIHRFRELLDAAPGGPPTVANNPGDLAALQYTGGTTGSSKGAMLTHANLSCQAQQLSAWLPELVAGEEVFLAALPFFHVFGLSVAMSLPVHVAAEVILLPNPREIPLMIDAINKHGVTIFPIVPAMVNGINQSPKVAGLKVGTLKICVSGSAPLPEDTLRSFEARTGGRIVEGYGLTEASPVTHVNPNNGVRKINTIGVPIPGTDCRIVSLEDGRTLGAGEEGELVIRGPQVMKGYWNQPEETAGTLRDGWLHTGDLASMDDDGYFRIVGRKKELIIAGGYNIYPDEIDEVLVSHPDILEAATIGVPDEKRGETVKSFVVLRPGASVSEEEITSYCRERLAAYKIPRLLEYRDELPKSSVLKILRRKLLEEELAAKA